MDLDDLEHNTRDGLHIASLAGSWIALVAGLGGLREHGTPSRSPLPPALTRLAFTLAFRGRRLHVALTPTAVSYRLRSGRRWRSSTTASPSRSPRTPRYAVR